MQTFRPDSDKDYIAKLEDRLATQIQETHRAQRMRLQESKYLRSQLRCEEERNQSLNDGLGWLGICFAVTIVLLLLWMTI